jgi:hypothetical protein
MAVSLERLIDPTWRIGKYEVYALSLVPEGLPGISGKTLLARILGFAKKSETRAV